MQKTVVWPVTYAENYRPLISLPFNGGVWWWCSETTSLGEGVQIVQGWVRIHHEDYTFQTGGSRTCEHSASDGTSFGKTSIHNSRFIHCTGVICENCSQHCPCTAGIQQCVCVCVHGGYQETWRKFTKLMFGGALSLLHSFKGGTNGFPDSVVTFGTWVHQFTQNELQCNGHIQLHWKPQNVKSASIPEGCGMCILCCRIRQNCIHSLRSQSECEHMLWRAGRGMNICHEVWSLNTVIPIQYTTNTRSCCSRETYGISNILVRCWPCLLDYYFWASDTTAARTPNLKPK